MDCTMYQKLLIVSLGLLVGHAHATEDYGKLSKRFLTNFQCANFYQEGTIEGHLNAGLEQGRKFYKAVQDNKITDDQSGSIPMILGFLLPGPNAEFYLGRVWQWAETDSEKKVREGCESCDTEGLEIRRRTLYREANCELVL